MPEYADEYRTAILAARNQVLTPTGVPKDAYDQLMQLYGRMISDINRELGSEVITSDRAEALSRIIKQRFNQLGEDIGVLYAHQKEIAMEAAVQGHAEGVARAASAVDMSLSVSFNGIAEEALETMKLRRGLNARNYQSVIKR